MKDKSTYTHLTLKAHLVNSLKIKLLLKMNVLGSEQFSFNFDLKTIKISSYKNLELFLKIEA